MNQSAQTYWNKYWGDTAKPLSVTAWQFGDTPDELAQLVIDGVKTATCSGHIFYELENEPLPTTEDYSIILNSNEEPVAIIKTVEVKLVPMNEVTEEFAVAEGDGTYQNWKDIHVRFFTNELSKHGLEFSEDMLLVCERFRLVDVKN
ncbi:ASCH domain-containing protein [Lederbergia citrea]|uniref:ASCH domain-containing protein n=1 Tax=Lederbergia citrea TaxID=2833581 RepID=A0A942URC9_9BACI|nr:ASCH domain-containing protein [Lederbergia citrea]MBS4224207.1 ASCH domain-containing protein [Lederbergia citrea]